MSSRSTYDVKVALATGGALGIDAAKAGWQWLKYRNPRMGTFHH